MPHATEFNRKFALQIVWKKCIMNEQFLFHGKKSVNNEKRIKKLNANYTRNDKREKKQGTGDYYQRMLIALKK